MILPRPRAVLLFGAGLPAMMAATAFEPDLWIYCAAAAAAVALVIAFDMLVLFMEPPPASDVDIPQETGIGDEAAVSVSLSRTGRTGSGLIETVVELDGPVRQTGSRKIQLPGRGTGSLEIPFAPLRRGEIRLTGLWMRQGGPLGLCERRIRRALDRVTTVAPNVAAVRRMALELHKLSRDFGQKQQRFHGDGSEFEALREFVPGLDTRYVDWKQSARHRKILVKEMKAERNHNVIISFDTGHLMAEAVDGMPKLDHAINAGLKLASLALSSGDLVGLYSFDENTGTFTRPVRGQSAFGHFRLHAARLRYNTTESNFTLGLTDLSSRLNRRSLVVLFTDFVDTVSAELLLDNMRLLSQRHLVLFVCLRDPLLHRLMDEAPASFDDVAEAVVADEFLQDRTVVFEKLRRLGIFVLDVPANEVSPQLINGYLSVKQRELL